MDQKRYAIRWHSERAAAFDRRYDVLQRDPYASTFAYGRHKIEQLTDRLLADCDPSSQTLDVGCGTGFNITRLRGRGFDVVGLEPAEGMRRLAEAQNPGAQIVGGDIEALPFPTQSFDVVLSIEVIRYLPSPHRGLSEIARVLRPGGVAIVTAAPRWSLNGYALWNKITSNMSVPGFSRVRQSFMSVNSASRALRQAGFRQGEVHGVFLGPWQLLGRISDRALRRTLRGFEPVDDALSDRGVFRDLSNHLVLVGRR